MKNVNGSRTEQFDTAVNKVIYMPQLLTRMHSIQKETRLLRPQKQKFPLKGLSKELSSTNLLDK